MTPAEAKREIVKRLRDAGWTYARIGKYLGVTKQAAWAMAQRHDLRKKGPAVHRPDRGLISWNGRQKFIRINKKGG